MTKSLSLKALVFNDRAMFVKKLHNELAALKFLSVSMLVVAVTGVGSFVGNISLMHFQNIFGFLLLLINRSLWYFCLACFPLLLHKILCLF